MNVVEISPTYDSVMTDDGEITSNIGPKVHPVKELKTMAQDVSNNKYNVGLHSVYIWDLQNKVADLSNNMEGVDADAIEQNTSNIAANNTSIVNLTDDLDDMKSHYTWRIGVASIYQHSNPSGKDIPAAGTISSLSDNQGRIYWSNINTKNYAYGSYRWLGRQGGSFNYSGDSGFGTTSNGTSDVYMLNFSLAVKSKSTPYNGDDMVKVQFIRQGGKVEASAQTQVYGPTILNLSRPVHLRSGSYYYFKVMQSQTNNVELDDGGDDAIKTSHTGAFSLYKIPLF